MWHLIKDWTVKKCAQLSKLPWIFPGALLAFNGAPGNIQGNLAALNVEAESRLNDHPAATSCHCDILSCSQLATALHHYTRRTTKLLGGVYWFHSIRPSVRPSICPSVSPASCVHSVAPTALVGSISYLYILPSNFRRCVACKVYCKILKL